MSLFYMNLWCFLQGLITPVNFSCAGMTSIRSRWRSSCIWRNLRWSTTGLWTILCQQNRLLTLLVIWMKGVNFEMPSLTVSFVLVGNFSALIFKFHLAREVGYYLMDYFIPSIMLVCTSWVTFWLQADNAAPRVTLGKYFEQIVLSVIRYT